MKRSRARQPILDCERIVYDYELLYRSGPENYFNAASASAASASSVDNLPLFGIERLAPACRSFLNSTRDFLIGDCAFLLRKERVVIEILETLEIDAEIVNACTRLKRRPIFWPWMTSRIARTGGRWWNWRTS